MIRTKETLEGVILVDKPQGMTSHDVVDRVRKLAHTRRVGHIGTLDPMATGLLVVCIGRATRIVPFLSGFAKEYTGVIRLGAISSTYDAEGSIVPQENGIPRDSRPIIEAMGSQVGWRMQLPPPYSAVKVRGKKLYEYARRGEEVPQKPRRVRIDQFELLEYREPEIRFRARVGSGTYIRSMAHDLGIQLGCGAYLAGLRRETVGHFHLENAVGLAALIEEPELLNEQMLDISEALGHLQRITVSSELEKEILHGKSFTTRDILFCETLPQAAEDLVVLNPQGKILSIVRGEPIDQTEGEQAIDRVPAQVTKDPDRMGLLSFRPLRVLATE